MVIECLLYFNMQDAFASINSFTPFNILQIGCYYYPCFTDSVQFSSVPQSCLTLCNPMDCSKPGFPVHHQLLELAQTHIHRVCAAIQHLILCHPLLLLPLSFSVSGFFPMTQFFISGGQSIGLSSSASVLPMNIQD